MQNKIPPILRLLSQPFYATNIHAIALLALLIQEFFNRVDILPWHSEAAVVYGNLRALCAASGIVLSALDMMIAAHAIATKSILVTHDKAFRLLADKGLQVEDWLEFKSD